MQKLKKLGFVGPYSGGSHQYMENKDFKIFMPNPHKKDIDVPLLNQIIKQLNISKEKFLEL